VRAVAQALPAGSRYRRMAAAEEGRRSEGRMGRGWRLTRAAWALMRRDPTMIYLALLGSGSALAGTAIVFAAAGLFSHDPQSRAHVALIGIGTARAGESPVAGVAMIAVGAVALVAAVALASATRQVFAVALFRYATDAPVGGFAEADLRYPFSLAGKTRRTRPWAWIALGLIVLAVAAAAIFAHPRAAQRRGSEGYSWAVVRLRGTSADPMRRWPACAVHLCSHRGFSCISHTVNTVLATRSPKGGTPLHTKAS